jgi:hypothetical protein
MLLKLKRTWKSDNTTIGTLLAYADNDLDNSLLRVFTLEDVERKEKIKEETAITKGRYAIVWTYSPSFKKDVLMLTDVPNFERIYIHAGNRSADTEGCILCGLIRRNDRIEMSREAVSAVYQLVGEALERGEKVFIDIV